MLSEAEIAGGGEAHVCGIKDYSPAEADPNSHRSTHYPRHRREPMSTEAHFLLWLLEIRLR
jgi:hypothetical protein